MNLNEGQNKLRHQRLMDKLRQVEAGSPRVLKALSVLPRHRFMPASFSGDAYEDAALPIGENQTISMPTVVAEMTTALNVAQQNKVLEIGTGSGYQLGILCMLARRVFSIERHKSLAERAEKTLSSLGFTNFVIKTGDGSLGWPEQAPFDRIMVTAASPEVPQALLDQLAVDGIMMIPIGPEGRAQRLYKVTRTQEGIETTDLGGVAFVPLIGAQGVRKGKTG